MANERRVDEREVIIRGDSSGSYVIIMTRCVSINFKRSVTRASETTLTLRALRDVSATSRRLFVDTGSREIPRCEHHRHRAPAIEEK